MSTKTKTTVISGDLVNVDTVRVTKVAMSEMAKVANADRLDRLVTKGHKAFSSLLRYQSSSLVSLVDKYRAMGEPMAQAINDGLVSSGRKWAEIMANGETTDSGRYMGESQWQRAHRIVENWADGEDTATVVGRFIRETTEANGRVGITEFVRWVGGSTAKRKKDDPSAVFAKAVAKYLASGGTVADAIDIVKDTAKGK